MHHATILITPDLRRLAKGCVPLIEQVLADERYGSETVCLKLTDPGILPKKAEQLRVYRAAKLACAGASGAPLCAVDFSVGVNPECRCVRFAVEEFLPLVLIELAQDVAHCFSQKLFHPKCYLETAQSYLALFKPDDLIRLVSDPRNATPARKEWLSLIEQGQGSLMKFIQAFVTVVAEVRLVLTVVDESHFELDGRPVDSDKDEIRLLQVFVYLEPGQRMDNKEFCRLYNNKTEDVAHDSYVLFKRLEELLVPAETEAGRGWRIVKGVKPVYKGDEAVIRKNLALILEPQSK